MYHRCYVPRGIVREGQSRDREGRVWCGDGER